MAVVMATGVSGFLISMGAIGSAFFGSTASGASFAAKLGHGDGASTAFGGAMTAESDDTAGAGLAGVATGVATTVSARMGGGVPGGRSAGASGDSRLSMRTLPVWLSVFTGSASVINCSMFLIGSGAGVGNVSFPPDRVRGRKTTPCMTGRVRVPSARCEAAFSAAAASGSTAGRGDWPAGGGRLGAGLAGGGLTILGASGGGRGGGFWLSGRFLAL